MGRKGRMGARLTSLIAAFAAGALLFVASPGGATTGAQTYTGCLYKGQLYRVAIGLVPRSGSCGSMTKISFANGTITSVTAGDGLTGGGSSADATLGLIPCADGEVLREIAGTWGCSNDAATTYTAGDGLTLTGAQFALEPCPDGQFLEESGGTWTCTSPPTSVTEIDTGTGLTGGPITGTGTISADTSVLQHRLDAGCPAGQTVRSVAATGASTCTNSISTSGFVERNSTPNGVSMSSNAFSYNLLLDSNAVHAPYATYYNHNVTAPASATLIMQASADFREFSGTDGVWVTCRIYIYNPTTTAFVGTGDDQTMWLEPGIERTIPVVAFATVPAGTWALDLYCKDNGGFGDPRFMSGTLTGVATGS